MDGTLIALVAAADIAASPLTFLRRVAALSSGGQLRHQLRHRQVRHQLTHGQKARKAQ